MRDDAVARLVDQMEIEEVLHRYCRGVDRVDAAELAACYHDDGTDDHGTFRGLGTDFARWATGGAADVWAASHHTVHNVIVEWVEPDVAHVESYVLAFNHRTPAADGSDGPVEVFAGRYLDRFERRDGRWRIQHRRALRDVDSLVERRRWAGKIPAGARRPDDGLYAADWRA
ncbi:MAG: nuclear transport factor 2 family protein [Acidimicrobiia bacterium]|nr:nuclear transport factor 2 family protein [Acidimicrobiia bacterium]